MAHRSIPVSHPLLAGNEKKYVNECLDTTWISSVGRFIPEFEAAFANFCETPHAIACCNGTMALHLALVAAGVGPGDEVILPTFTYVASANAIRYCNAIPVFVDSEPLSMNMDPGQITSKITGKTKAIVAVHLYGHPVDMHPVLDIARRHGLVVIEDAAEALGARYKGRLVGSLGDIGTFSFFGNKTITTGEGGMLITSNAELAARLRLLRGQGMDPERRYWFPMVGYNYRMTNIEAAIGLGQLEMIDTHLSLRRRIAQCYAHHLAEVQDVFLLPGEEPWAHHSYWMYTIIVSPEAGLERDAVMRQLAEAGVETRPAFYPMHTMPVYREAQGSYPVAEHLGANGINLPTHGLLNEDDIHYVAHQLQSVRSAALTA